MTEPFRVPEPSKAAIRAAVSVHPTIWPDCLIRAYAVDFQPFAKAEVERALRYVAEEDGRGIHDEYLATRFPEAAPETKEGTKKGEGWEGAKWLEPIGEAGLDSPLGAGPLSSSAAVEAASGRARGEDAKSFTPQPSAEPSLASDPGGPCFHEWPFAGVGAVCTKCGYVWPAPTIELPTPQPSPDSPKDIPPENPDFERWVGPKPPEGRVAPEQARCEYCRESFAGEAALSFHSCPHPIPQPSAEPGPCMFNFCPTPEKCVKECQSQNPLRKKNDLPRERGHGRREITCPVCRKEVDEMARVTPSAGERDTSGWIAGWVESTACRLGGPHRWEHRNCASTHPSYTPVSCRRCCVEGRMLMHPITATPLTGRVYVRLIDAPVPTPTEGERMTECRKCGGTGWVEGGTAIMSPCAYCGGNGCVLVRLPTPNCVHEWAGEPTRCVKCGTPQVTRHPSGAREATPSAGEGVYPHIDGHPQIRPNAQGQRDASREWCGECHNSLLGAYVCTKPLGHVGKCRMVEREKIRDEDLRVEGERRVSAGETKYPDGGCGCVSASEHLAKGENHWKKHLPPLGPAVGARPEERDTGGFRPEKHIGHTEHGDRVYAMNGVCTACACEKCKARDAFVDELAWRWASTPIVESNLKSGCPSTLEKCVAAARRVTA